MRILVIGENGQLGKSLKNVVDKKLLNDSFVFVGRRQLDLSNNSSIINYFKDNRFDVIINCAAYTFVDKAELEVEVANQVNNLAVKQIAEIASLQTTKLIHISTDYVFDGESDNPYSESDKTNPLNVYGKTKLAGEQAILLAMPNNAIIIRTSWIYSEFGNNFVDTILGLGKEQEELEIVCDQFGSPTYASDLAKAILHITTNEQSYHFNKETQIYHYSNEGFCSWYDFANEIIKLASINCTLKSITTENYKTIVVRPKNTLMSKGKISKTFGVQIYNWKKSLKDCLDQIASNKI